MNEERLAVVLAMFHGSGVRATIEAVASAVGALRAMREEEGVHGTMSEVLELLGRAAEACGSELVTGVYCVICDRDVVSSQIDRTVDRTTVGTDVICRACANEEPCTKCDGQHHRDAACSFTKGDIEALMREAGEAGDAAMVSVCERALAGHPEEVAEVGRVIAAARALADEPDEVLRARYRELGAALANETRPEGELAPVRREREAVRRVLVTRRAS